MQTLNKLLLLSDDACTAPQELYSCWNVRGLYSPLQFVLRLRPDIHRALSTSPVGVIARGQLSDEQVLAFSTYLHETIHWWQHVGSTTGLMLSLIYPAQSHSTHDYLKAILPELGAIKPIREFNLRNAKPHDLEGELERNINVALNNWHDIEFYRWLVIDPRSIKHRIDDPYFECVGHSYRIATSSVVALLSATIDPNLEIFPDPRPWEAKFMKLREDRARGFYYGSPVFLPPIGAREIFEGQARFSQLQYLYLSSGRSITWADFEGEGMFRGVYVEAFECFLRETGLEKPSALDDPVIGLFLLVCDVSISPAECITHDLADFENLVEIHDPGIRFVRLCFAISEDAALFQACISDYSAEEYWAVSTRLCASAGFESPRSLSEAITCWPRRFEKIAELLEEDKTFKFGLGNLPVRVFLARFIRLQIDKYNTPEFFCWPGIWMTTAKRGPVTPEVALSLFEEHRALFIDKEDGDVYPRSFLDRDELAVQEAFDTFYSWVAIYDLTRQWLVSPGEFDYDFSWLTSKYSQQEMEDWASSRFEALFGVSPRAFTII